MSKIEKGQIWSAAGGVPVTITEAVDYGDAAEALHRVAEIAGKRVDDVVARILLEELAENPPMAPPPNEDAPTAEPERGADETPAKYVVIQPAATIYTTAEEAKAQAMRMAKTSGGVWAVGRVEGRAVAQPPAPVPPKWEADIALDA